MRRIQVNEFAKSRYGNHHTLDSIRIGGWTQLNVNCAHTYCKSYKAYS